MIRDGAGDSNSRGRPAPDPRTTRTRQAVMQAVAVLLGEDGVSAVTHQKVAERSGVGRATLYRHWPTAADLLYAVMAEVDEPFFHDGEGPLVPWLRAEMRRAVRDLSQPISAQFTAFLIERAALEPVGAQLRAALLKRTAAPLARALERAVAAGELAELPETDDLLAQLLGPVLFRVVHAGGVATDAFVDRVIDLALSPWLPESRAERSAQAGKVIGSDS